MNTHVASVVSCTLFTSEYDLTQRARVHITSLGSRRFLRIGIRWA